MRHVSGRSDGYRSAVELARRAWGVVARAQLLDIGVPATTVESWLRRGMLRRLHRGVYAVGHDVLRPEGRFLAAVLASGEGAALSHATAAHHLDLRRSSAALIDVMVPRTRRAQRGIRLHRPRSLQPGDVIVHEGVLTTSPTRTVIDLARSLPLAQLENVVARAEQRDLLDHRRLSRAPSRKLDLVLGRGARITRSPHEDRLLDGIRAAGLPEPETNVWLTHGGGEEWQADLLYRTERVIVEVDDDSHKTTRAFDRDRDKDAVRQADGYATLRFTRRQLRDELEAKVAQLQVVLARRAAASPFRSPRPER